MAYFISVDGIIQENMYSSEEEAAQASEELISKVQVKSRDKFNRTKWYYPEIAIIEAEDEVE